MVLRMNLSLLTASRLDRRSAALLVALLFVACGRAPYRAADTVLRSSTLAAGEAYFSAPWPDDRRLRDGFLSTRDFPNPSQGELATNLFDTAHRLVGGAGLSSPIYVPLGAAIDPASLPDLRGSLAAGATLFLVALDGPAGAAFDGKIPVEWHLQDTATAYLPAHTLIVRPLLGVPLRPLTRYALVLTTGIKDATGRAIGADRRLWDILHGADASEGTEAAVYATERAHYAQLVGRLPALGLSADQVALAVVFKTQPILDELLRLAAHAEGLPDPAVGDLTVVRADAELVQFSAQYQAPYYLHGDAPYVFSGGGFVFDAGVPRVAKVETMQLSVVLPRGPAPAAGFPVVMYSHGTGGAGADVRADIGRDLAARGIASVGIDQVLHGPRAPAGANCFGQPTEFCFFNPANANAGRNLVRQAALDHVTLKKALRAFVVDVSKHPDGVRVQFDSTRVGFFGHSQGGLTGAIYAAIERDRMPTVLSGAGGFLTNTVLLRTDPIDLRALAAGPLFLNLPSSAELDINHPALALLQTLGEVSDPLSYARYLVSEPLGEPKPLYLTTGVDDPYTPTSGTVAMAAAAAVPQLEPATQASIAYELLGLSSVTRPVAARSETRGVMAVLRSFPGEGHFPVFSASATADWVAFFVSAFFDGGAALP